jgi:crossover junction endodeoxyribonuclease RuvC
VRVAGLDISMSSTGLAIIDDTEVVPISTRRITSEPVKRPDGLAPSLQDRQIRLRSVEDRIMVRLGMCPPGTRGISKLPDLVLVEGPSLGSFGGQMTHESAGNWHRIVARLFDLGIPVAEVSPSQVTQYATGSGSTQGKTKVTKEMVISAVQAAYGDVGAAITQNDEADALVLAAIAARYLGHPAESFPLPAANLAALKKIRWPERTLI